MTLVIGLTGSIATGKSTVAERFKQARIPIVDADVISHQVIACDTEAYKKIVTTFGQEIVAKDQTIDRKKLGELIFNQQAKRDQLNQIMHPMIIDQIITQRNQLIDQGYQLIVLDIPLLFELNLIHLVDKIIVVYASKDQQLTRLKMRDQLTNEQAKQRINAQMSIEEKKQKADYLIDNSGSKEETEKQLDHLIARFK